MGHHDRVPGCRAKPGPEPGLFAAPHQPLGAGSEVGGVFGLGRDAGKTNVIEQLAQEPRLVLLEKVYDRLHEGYVAGNRAQAKAGSRGARSAWSARKPELERVDVPVRAPSDDGRAGTPLPAANVANRSHRMRRTNDIHPVSTEGPPPLDQSRAWVGSSGAQGTARPTRLRSGSWSQLRRETGRGSL